MEKINMRMVILAMALLSSHANAQGIKELVAEALNTGKSEGFLTGGAETMFKYYSKSTEPVGVVITRIKTFNNGCGRLRFGMKQEGVKDNKGNPTTLQPWVVINLCPDGTPPIEILEAKKKEALKLQACHVKVEKGETDKATGAQHGAITASGCPKEGMSHWRYEGDCEILKMPAKAVTITPITKDGSINIELLMPEQCQSKKNIWSAWIQEKAEGEALGMLKASW